MLDNGNDIFRIQVKSTRKKSKHENRYSFTVSYGGNLKKVYDRTHIDFVVLYLSDINTFYIVPIDKVKSQNITIYHASKNSKYKKYCEAWNLLS